MPALTINGKTCSFQKGQSILQVAIESNIKIPQYCYHPSLSVPGNCRICLAEVWHPNPKTGALESMGKLVPTCHTPANDDMVVYTDSPKAVANQKQVMEYLLINHPVDCPVCDQAGECDLQDYSYQYGRGESRFQEDKIKQPKKDIGPNILLYSDRCIMCTRCVRFTREVTQTAELMVDGRGGTESIDVFPGMALDNELASNVIDLCPVGALLDKDFLFQQRVWFLKKAASIDGITASGDNISVEHNEGRVYRIKPRTNMEVNQWWITDEVRYGWKFVHAEDRLSIPAIRGREAFGRDHAGEAWLQALNAARQLLVDGASAGRLGLLVSPMLSCEEAYLLAHVVLGIDPNAVLAVGPVPVRGEDKTFPNGFKVLSEKAPNARGVRRVLEAVAASFPARTVVKIVDAAGFAGALRADVVKASLVTGNYPSAWVTADMAQAVASAPFVLLDTLPNALTGSASVLLPVTTWVEKSGTFVNAKDRAQHFSQAISPIDFARSEGQVAIDLDAIHRHAKTHTFDVEAIRTEMATTKGLEWCDGGIHRPSAPSTIESDMVLVEL
ncbi:MAG: 2Fe-2S iron-sulfur cluster-binding protein [Planctomycetota bacterium]|nr:2Fe-2S iron-sulfur cluster-binding protein [Planctomycetota bacterium]MDA1106404.1 2Fe-2S iron-sulfur cluster-binding protein [Planctomycetota bacterium]